jgi:hypothetical protein
MYHPYTGADISETKVAAISGNGGGIGPFVDVSIKQSLEKKQWRRFGGVHQVVDLAGAVSWQLSWRGEPEFLS